MLSTRQANLCSNLIFSNTRNNIYALLLFSLPIFDVYNDIITEYQSCYLISAANSSRTFAALGPIWLALASYYDAGRNFIFIMDIVFLCHAPYLYSMHWDSSYHRYTAARWSIAEELKFTLCVFEITFSLKCFDAISLSHMEPMLQKMQLFFVIEYTINILSLQTFMSQI